MEVCNIKFHFYIKPEYTNTFFERLYNCKFIHKQFTSFCIIRIGKIVYSCFYSGFVNVTGVLNFDLKATSQKILLLALQLNQDREQIFCDSVVDNITSKLTTLTKRKVNLIEKKKKICLDSQILAVKYDRQRFPNMFVKTKFGTIIWSPNNIATAVGSKTLTDLEKICKIILDINTL